MYQKEALANHVSKAGIVVFGVGIISMAWLEIQFDKNIECEKEMRESMKMMTYGSKCGRIE